MRPIDILLTELVDGNMGLLIEVYFTAAWSVIFHKDRRAMGTTSLWLVPVYGTAGLVFGLIHDAFPHAWVPLIALLYTVLIYVQELFWHWVLSLFKVKVWDYGPGKFTMAGRVQPKYFPFWYLLACGFNPLHEFLMKVFGLVGKYG